MCVTKSLLYALLGLFYVCYLVSFGCVINSSISQVLIAFSMHSDRLTHTKETK